MKLTEKLNKKLNEESSRWIKDATTTTKMLSKDLKKLEDRIKDGKLGTAESIANYMISHLENIKGFLDKASSEKIKNNKE